MIEVKVSDHRMMDGLAIWVIMKAEGMTRRVLRMRGGDVYEWEEVPDPAILIEPTVTLQNDAGRALLEALLRHYQGASDMHTVRQDLLHERGRVDKLINAMIDIAAGSE